MHPRYEKPEYHDVTFNNLLFIRCIKVDKYYKVAKVHHSDKVKGKKQLLTQLNNILQRNKCEILVDLKSKKFHTLQDVVFYLQPLIPMKNKCSSDTDDDYVRN